MKNLLLSFGLVFSSVFLHAQIVNIPDANFKNALVNTNCVDIDGDGYGDVDADTNNDGEIQLSEAEAVIGLNVRSQNIGSLEGIQSFFNLTYLNCSWNNLENLDINTLLNLEVLLCEHNNLITINVVPLVNIQVLSVDANQNLMSLDISQNINLKGLYAFDTPITSLDTTQNPLLEILWLGINNLTELDLSQNINLRRLFCHTNQLSSLNIKNGNNNNMDTMVAYSNPNLQCIMVDDENASRPLCSNNLFGWCVGGGVVYSEDCVLAAQNFPSLDIQLFPNPSEDMLNIQSKIPIENVKIYSPQGVLVNEYTSNSIDVSQLSSGMYFVEVMVDGRKATMKFIKK